MSLETFTQKPDQTARKSLSDVEVDETFNKLVDEQLRIGHAAVETVAKKVEIKRVAPVAEPPSPSEQKYREQLAILHYNDPKPAPGVVYDKPSGPKLPPVVSG